MNEPRKPGERSVVGSLLDDVKETFCRAARLREWQSLDGCERRRVAQDLGLSGGDVGTLIAESGGTAELDELLRRGDLQQTAAMRGALPDLQRVCALCRQRSECRDWLSVPAEARDDAALPYFCPNREELEVLREMQGGGYRK
ncbi:hypothetical protein FNB15_18475 [Ferrovibrio terrae]|uniref:DUF6455 domain-containing protein n=1 Tax=Ferrovibrio terrae TaxID=2594003 RepID=A0A516H5Y9_9PROT|nr:DUF6455 family protein [Ferrovibrio terrae]QDO99135.1 hypothetical protein FNB15_18475 [Ferrovibrio terrae]